MKLLLEKIQYEKYYSNICGDLKFAALLLGLQLGYIRICYGLCEIVGRENIIITINSDLK
jgi:hypothetical protein